jgi:flagellar hook-associated protein 1 FlgK
MGTNVFSASLSGMNAAMYGITTTQHNIANASTPGYSRQQVTLSSATAVASGSGFVGQGVSVTGIKRLYDQFLTSQVLQQQGQSNYLSSYLTSMNQVNTLVSNTTSGVSASLQGFFAATNTMSSTPASVPARQTVLSAAQSTVNNFQSINQSLSDMAVAVTGQISSSVQLANTYATQIASLNTNIKTAIASNQGQQPNDLLDQRDQLVSQLNQQINVSVQQQNDGTMNIYIGSGQALVVGDKSMSLQVQQTTNDPSKVDVVYVNNGKVTQIQQNSLQGGNLGAYIAFRDQNLQPAQNALGRVALAFATNINQQNQMGQDLNGTLGASLMNAAPPVVSAGGLNTGAGVVSASISSVTALTGSDYQLKFDGTNYSLTRSTDNAITQLGSALPISQVVDGVTITVAGPPAGAMAAGDSYQIRPTANAARDIAMLTTDPAKIAAAAPMLASAPVTNTGTGKIASGSVNTPLPLNANLQSPVTLTFTSATTFTVAGAVPAVGVQTYTPGQNITFNGWTTQISGSPATGDVFNVKSNVGGTGDNRNALLMAKLQTQNLMANGTTSLEGAYSQLVSSIGSKTSELTVTSSAQTAMLAQTVAAQQSVSGVNLDEEAANLLQYQRAYQASAKAMQIANTLFDALLTLR